MTEYNGPMCSDPEFGVFFDALERKGISSQEIRSWRDSIGHRMFWYRYGERLVERMEADIYAWIKETRWQAVGERWADQEQDDWIAEAQADDE